MVEHIALLEASIAPGGKRSHENYHIVYGNSTFLKVNSQNRLCGVDGASSASLFQLEKCADDSDGAFRIGYGNSKCYVAQCDGDSVQVTTMDKRKPLEFTLNEEFATFSDWGNYGDQLKLAGDDRYLGYCCKTGLVKIFSKDIVENPGVVILECHALQICG